MFLWSTSEPERLSPGWAVIVASREHEIFLSIASIWEIAIKVGAGKLDFPLHEFEKTLARLEIKVLPITLAHALRAGMLPRLHTDPFDRMLVAQAVSEGLALMTVDREMAKYEVPILAATGLN